MLRAVAVIVLGLLLASCIGVPPQPPPRDAESSESADSPGRAVPFRALLEEPARDTGPAVSPEFAPDEQPSGFQAASQLPTPSRARSIAAVDPSRWQLEWVPLSLHEDVPQAAKQPIRDALTRIHWRMHHVFARFSNSVPAEGLDGLQRLVTRVGFEFEARTGRLLRLGVVTSSGSKAFDVAALESFLQAFPIEMPESIVPLPESFFVSWRVHGYAPYACSTYFAVPYMIRDEAAHSASDNAAELQRSD